ncbi:MAG: flagellar hook assembly protein FlgD [Lachnospiraceae bacterium]
MAITAIVDNGKISSTGSTNTDVNGKEIVNDDANAVDEDMFLQLLVAEMKFQDPLEPTSNTEWISQYATFTQIEQSTAMQGSLKQMEASQLVGKQVIMKTTNSITGETSYFSGMVDYMYVENGEVYLSVNNNLYSIDDLDTVVDPDYMDAVTCAQSFKNMMEKMPTEKGLTASDAKLVEQAREAYDSMTDYQKTFVEDALVTQLKTLEARLKEIMPEADDTDSTDEINESEVVDEVEDSESSEEPEETDETVETE